MPAGKYNQRVTLETQSVTRNSVGDEVIAWLPIATCWAEVRTFVATERYIAGAEQQQAKSVYQVQMRWRDGISVKDRVRWRDQTLEITSTEDRDGRKWELTLMCEGVLS